MMKGMGCLLVHTKKEKNFENAFVLKMGGKRRALARALGPPPIFRTKAFSKYFSFFCEITNISNLPSLYPRAKFESF